MQVGHWQKICDLGSGAFGVVSMWKNDENGDQIAIKMCKFSTNQNLTEKQRMRWHSEVEMMKIINHLNVIKHKRIPEDLEGFLLKNNPTGLPILSMEYCRKGNLRHVLLKPQNLSGLEDEDVRFVLGDISSGLQHLHNLKITHRDLKPDNIVLQYCSDRKNETVYKIIDLGYAKELGDSIVSFVGTLHYLAPEIFETQNYNHGVDYWSMGILTFEVITGILPFLDANTPFQRFDKIKMKGPDDIFIYHNYSGNVTNSTEMKKENLISSCLKNYIEIWLRRVLNYDPQMRLQNFPEETKTLDYLTKALQKQIVNVFSLFKLEKYSYEITEGTRIGTLKDWISRDIKVNKTDLILLMTKDSFGASDNDLLLDVLKGTDVFVTGKYFLPDKLTYNYPKLIKEVMKSAVNFNTNFAKPLKSQLIYFITVEKTAALHFQTSFNLYLNYLNHVLGTIKHHKTSTTTQINQLVTKISCYNNIKINAEIDLKSDIEYKNCLKNTQRLLSSFERSFSDFSAFEKQIKQVSNRLKVLSKVTEKIQKIIESYNLEDEYKTALKLLEQSNTRTQQFYINVAKLISSTIRRKESVFRNKELSAFFKVIGNVLTHCFDLIEWIREYNKHNEELLLAFEENKRLHLNLMFKAAQKETKAKGTRRSSMTKSLALELIDLPVTYLIQQNQDLRSSLQEVLSSIDCYSDQDLLKPVNDF
ncbi:unnamed protein product [Phyllotreta striolata]|uniref:IkappaB kinase n=1 Tax=Phyllotreta striolata TaxID=444603 RepID=A0A9N9XNE4_PHYSR|nr:unnamed protein product [Phyllotreta striolata]